MEKLGNKKMKKFSFSLAMQFNFPDFLISKFLNFA